MASIPCWLSQAVPESVFSRRRMAQVDALAPAWKMWIGYEVQHGSVLSRCDGAQVCRLTPRSSARALFRGFVAAPRALLRGSLTPE